MKIVIVCIACLIHVNLSWAQLKTTPVCVPFEVDVLDGSVNKFTSKSTLGEIKKAFPCSNEIVEEPATGKCAGIFFNDYGLYFFTDRNYIEITDKFKGKLTPQLIGYNRSDLFKLLGYPKIKDVQWDAFGTVYGTLVLYYNAAGKINKLQMSTKSTETLKLCE